MSEAINTILCFSHLRWNFVFQRPQHLMRRFARDMDVIFWEEPVEIGANEMAYLEVCAANGAPGVRIVVPHLPAGIPEDARETALTRLLDTLLDSLRGSLIAWYYTPMMLPFSLHIEADVIVYDAMDELSKFKFAPAKLLDLEQELIERADIVFTGGSSLTRRKSAGTRTSTASPRRSTLRTFARREPTSLIRPTRRTCPSRGLASMA